MHQYIFKICKFQFLKVNMMCGAWVCRVAKSGNFSELICLIFNYVGVQLCACERRCLQNWLQLEL